jgi:molybdopterin/thiamine biosynthesis adenylyltransferase
MNYIIIGAGGVGSWLTPALVRMCKQTDLIQIWDGDTLEEGNLDRQLFEEKWIGENKALALANKYKHEAKCEMTHVSKYYTHGAIADIGTGVTDWWLFGCADNHPARADILLTCDTSGCPAIIGGNGYDDADAYYYDSTWLGTPCDPRIYYPEIMTDTTGSPIHAAGCTGEAQDETPQLVLANYWAAAHMLHLFWYHTHIKQDQEGSDLQFMPMLSRNSAYMFETLTVETLLKEHVQKIERVANAL